MIKPCNDWWARFLVWWHGEDYYADDCPRCRGQKKMEQKDYYLTLSKRPKYLFRRVWFTEMVKCWRCKGRGFLISQVGSM